MGNIVEFLVKKESESFIKNAAAFQEVLRKDSLSLCLKWLRENYPDCFEEKFIGGLLEKIGK